MPKLNGEECRQFGFFFKKFVLNSKTFMALNIIPSISLLVMCTVMVGTIIWKMARKGKGWRTDKKYIPLDSAM